jgi:RNA polymerase sigma-70 factor (sigma-E family)
MADEPTIEAFVAARGDALVRFAYVLTGDMHLARDLVQSALAKVLRRWPTISDGDSPEAYLRRVIVTENLSWRRRRSSTERPVAAIPDSSGADAFAGVDVRDEVWRLLAQLPRKQRAVLVLRYLEDWDDEQIAAVLGCAPVTVRSQAARAMTALRARLGAAITAPESIEQVGGESF